ncbi:MAG TPA: hypothetical protein VL117_09345 [Thermoleophilia bacterium]|nr:hypothetical protein [Thermoleophilia bacterium]
MADDRRHGGAGEMHPSDPTRSLLVRLDGYSVMVERIRAAEAHYLKVVAGSPSRRDAKAKRAYETEIAKALDRLAEAVVDLQESRQAVRSLADDEGISEAALRALDASFDAAHREYAGYLAARTYQQVRAAASDRALRERHPT